MGRADKYPRVLPMSRMPPNVRRKLKNGSACSHCGNLLLAVRLGVKGELHPFFCSECDR